MIDNICHFIFGLEKQISEFMFCYYIAVYSAYLINEPDFIYFYYHYEPYGKWWNELKKIPNIKLVIVELPTKIGEKVIKKTAHRADKLRMDILYNKGGIYLDIDTICIKPWKELLKEKVVLGKQDDNKICNAIMFTEPKSLFFKLWLDKYEEYFNPNGWGEASIILPFIIYKENPKLVTLKEPNLFFKPTYHKCGYIFEYIFNIPDKLITLHLWETYSYKYKRLELGI